MNPARTNCWMTGWFLVQRLNLLHPARPYFFDRFFGTSAPFLRASERPIAITCFLLLTFLPDLPLLSVPALRFFMARPTFFEAPLAYFLLSWPSHWSFVVSGASKIGPQRSRRGRCGAVTTSHHFAGPLEGETLRGDRVTALIEISGSRKSMVALQRRQHVLPCCEPTN